MTTTDAIDLVTAWAAAEQANDAEALDSLLSDAFVGVGPFGFVLTRQQWLGRFQAGLVNTAFAVEDAQTYEQSESAVTVVGVLAQQTSYQGNDNSGRFRVTVQAVRPDADWRMGSVHIGPLQTPPRPPAT